MKNDVAVVKQNAIAFNKILKEATQEGDEKYRKMAEENHYVV